MTTMREQTAATIHVGVNSSAVDSESTPPSAIPLLSRPVAPAPHHGHGVLPAGAGALSGAAAAPGERQWSGSPGTPVVRFGLLC